MSQIEKLLVPLIDDSITINDISSNKFIGVFTEDINSPGLDYIYLVYVYDMNDLHLTLSKNSTDTVRRIGNQLYHIIKFPRVSLDLKYLLKGDLRLISNEGVYKIYKFWKNYDVDTANYPFAKTIASELYYRAIPEETFVPLCKQKPQGITVEKQ